MPSAPSLLLSLSITGRATQMTPTSAAATSKRVGSFRRRQRQRQHGLRRSRRRFSKLNRQTEERPMAYDEKLATLETLVRGYLRELANPVRDYALIHLMRERMEKMVGK
jgi:hypothetical protein